MERDPNLQNLASILTAVLFSDESQSDAPKPSHFQIDAIGDGSWVPVAEEVWRAWAGPRAVWGVPYHGPVYALGAPPDSPPWTGARSCRCDTCQAHVAPDRRPN